MAYERLRQQMLTRRLASSVSSTHTSSLSAPIRGVGRLPAGSHTVIVTAVDCLWLPTRGYVELTLTLGTELYQRHKLYVRPRGDDRGWSPAFRSFMRAMLPMSSHAVYLDAIDTYGLTEMLQVLRGMRVGVVLTLGQGYTVEQTATGYLRIHGSKVEEFEDLPSLIEDAQSREIPKARLTLKEFYDAGTSDANANALRIAIQTLDAARLSSGNNDHEPRSTKT